MWIAELGDPDRPVGIAPTMTHVNPVFIVGEARSGTSILYRTL